VAVILNTTSLIGLFKQVCMMAKSVVAGYEDGAVQHAQQLNQNEN